VGLINTRVNLRSAELPEDPGFFCRQEFFGANAQVDRLGNFEWKERESGQLHCAIVRGRYGRAISFLKSVTLGGRDVSTGFAASGPATLDLGS
jgi:hypothetical protein